jgi:serine/threonine protein phosphatase PrpC
VNRLWIPIIGPVKKLIGSMTLFGMGASAVGAILSGGFLKILADRFSMSKNEQYQALIMLVEQLQKNVDENNKKVSHLERTSAEWREKYYKELEEKNKLANDVRKLTLELQRFNKNHNDN